MVNRLNTRIMGRKANVSVRYKNDRVLKNLLSHAEEQVSIELTFEPVTLNRACVAQGGTSAVSYAVDTDEVKFVADYIYYPQEMMSAYAVQNPEITINHFDYRHSKVSVSATSTSGTTQIRNLGGAGRIVTKVITGLQADASKDETITNQYHAISPESTYDFGEIA